MIRKGKIVTDKETDLHKQAEEALRESEEKYRAIIEHMEEGYHEVDIRGNFTFFNESMRKIIGYEREELLGMNNRQYSDEENAREVYQVYNRVYRTGEPVKNFEWKIVRKDGDRRDIEVSISLIRDREGHPTGFRGIVRDTTDRKQGEEALRDANSRMKSIIEGTHVGTWEWNVQTGETVFNEVWAQIIGYTLKELAPISIKTWETFAHPDDLKQSGELLERHFAGELPYYDCECRMKHKDGHWVWVHDRGRVITRTANGKPLMMFGTHTDISERKQAKEALVKSEEKLRMITENMVDCVALVDASGTYQYVTPSYRETLGYDAEDMIGITGFGITHPDDLDRVLRIYLEGIDQGWCETSYETRLRHKDGHYVPMEIRARSLKGPQGKIVGGVLAARDITQRQQLEKERREAEENYRSIFEKSIEGICQTTLDGRFINVNPALARMFRYNSPEEMISSVVDIGGQLYVNPEQRKEHLRLLNEKVVVENYEAQMYRKNGSIIWVSINTRTVRDDTGNLLHYEGFVTDITKRKEVEDLYRTLANHAQSAISIIQEGRFRFVNPFVTVYTGYEVSELIGMDPVSLIHPDDRETTIRSVIQMIKGELSSPYVFRNVHKDGSSHWIIETVTPVVFDGKSAFLLNSMDITERKQAEEALRLSEERFRFLSEAAFEAIAIHEEGVLLNANEQYFKMFGYEPGEALGKEMMSITIAPESIESVKKQIATDDLGPYESIGLRKNGTRFPMEIRVRKMDYKGHNVRFGAIRDITDRKQAEERLHESEVRYRELFENMGSGVSVYETCNNGEDFIFREYNAAAEMLNKTPRGQAIGRSVFDVFPGVKDFGLFDVFRRVYRTGIPERHPITFYKDERISGWRDNYVYKLPSGEIVAVFEDVTERKRADEQLHASLREKEILLSEIHHRVKNNMQVISGLLDLQARSSGNPELTGMLNESQSRIRSMALIHEKLYASKDFTKIDLAGYVRTLSQELFQTYKINAGKIDLVIQTDGAVYVDISKAIPCGLILNELLSNALKHAFPGDEPGEIKIIIGEAENAEMWISFRDNGLGLPNDVDIHQPRTVGLHLVNGLVTKQLDGQIEVRRGAGTEFQITIPYDLSEERSL